MVFPVVTYGCEIWTINKAEHQRTDVFELVLEKILEDPFNLKIKPINPKGNQPWIYTGKTDAESEAGASILMVTWCEEPSHWKSPASGEDQWQRIRGWQRVRWLNSITNSMNMNLSKVQEIVKGSRAWHVAVHGVTKSHKHHSYWTTTTRTSLEYAFS